MLRHTILITLACAVVGLALPARGDDRSDCNGEPNHAAIDACTRVIQSGSSTGIDLAMVYYGRGRSHRMMGDNDGAIADYNESARLNPDYAPVFLGRGLAVPGGQLDQDRVGLFRGVLHLPHQVAGRL